MVLGFSERKNFFVPVFLLKSFILNCFSKCNHYFQSVVISWVLIAENITEMSHTQLWFYWNSTFQNWILLKLHCLHCTTSPLGQNGSRQDNMVRKKIIFSKLLTKASVRSIKQRATQTPGRKIEKTCEKLTILIEKNKIMEKQLYWVWNYSYISHSYNFQPRTKESGKAWKVITENFSSYSLFDIGCHTS